LTNSVSSPSNAPTEASRIEQQSAEGKLILLLLAVPG
jgi:hypothetical protein